MTIVVGALIAVLLILVLWVRNGLVRKQNHVREALAEVEVQLDRRHVLVPRWAAAVGGAYAQERQVLERVAQAAEQTCGPGSDVSLIALAEGQLTDAVHDLELLTEASPNLGSGANALRLHEDLLSTENRVAFARQHYNDSAMLFNSAVLAFPRTLVARLAGIRPAAYLDLHLLGERRQG